MDRRKVPSLERLWRGCRIAICQGRASNQCDDLLGNAVDRTVVSDLLRLRKCRRNDLDGARPEELGGIVDRTGGLRAVSGRHWTSAARMGRALFQCSAMDRDAARWTLCSNGRA